MSTQGNKVRLTIVSGSGDIEDEFSLNTKVGALKKQVMGRLKIDPSTAKEYRLVYDGEPLSENKRLEDIDLPNEAVIDLEPEPEVI